MRLEQSERLLVPRHAVRRAGAAHLGEVLEVPVVGGAQRLGVREPRLPAEQRRGLARSRRTSPCAPSCSATPRAARAARARAPAATSSAGLTGTGRSREPEPAWSISACRSSRTVPNEPAPTLSASPPTGAVKRADDRVDEVLDREQLVAIARRRRGSGSGGPRESSRTGSRRRRAAPGRRTSSAGRSRRRAHAGRTRPRAARPRSSTRRTSPTPTSGSSSSIGCRSGTP